MKIHYLTYATHKYGRFDKLINNKYGVNIKVLGFGKKWNNFIDKPKGIYNYIIQNKVNDNDIIVFVDGFDTEINKNCDNLLETFNKFNCSILISSSLSNYINKKIFGNYQYLANSGLFIGYANKIKFLCKKIINSNMKDDQQALNYVINKYKNLNTKIDVNNIIFYNKPIFKKIDNNFSPFFTQYPGGGNSSLSYKINRYTRSIHEYYKYFINDIFLLIILIIFFIKFIIYIKKKYN